VRFQRKHEVKMGVFGDSAGLNVALSAKTRSENVRFRQHSSYSKMKQNLRVFCEYAAQLAFSLKKQNKTGDTEVPFAI
jgi:hypothetical protein